MPSTASDVRDAKERILDAAERRFAANGFAGTSLRAITADADANLAAVNYHFGSKEALIEAVFTRRLRPLNEERLRELRAAMEQAGDGEPTLERIVEAFVGPPLRASQDPARGGMAFMRLLGHAMNQPLSSIRMMLAGQFRGTAQTFVDALQRALPHLSREDVMWRLIFMVGAMAHTMCLSDDLCKLTDGHCNGHDTDGLLRRLVAFVSQGLRAES